MQRNTSSFKKVDHKQYDIIWDKPLNTGESSILYPIKDQNMVVKALTVNKLSMEIDNLQNLMHPNLVEISGYDVVEIDENTFKYFFFMEKANCNLKDFLNSNPDYFKNTDNFIDFLIQMIKVGVYLEAKKVPHNNIKQENILIFDNNMFKLADTAFTRPSQLQPSTTTSANSSILPVLDTSKSLTREESLNLNLDDVFSMAAIFLEACRLPLTTITSFSLRSLDFQNYAKIIEFEWIVTILQKMLELDTKKRLGFASICHNLLYTVDLNNNWATYYKLTFSAYQRFAEQGDSYAQNELGRMYRHGYAVKKNDASALEWFQKSAEQGNSSAQNNVGWIHQNGLGVEKNNFLAIHWYEKAAKQGSSSAQYNLGIIYKIGYGVEVDFVKAFQWYLKSAEQGNASAQNNLGWMYKHGKGIEKSYTKAIEWYRIPAEQGNSSAQYNLGVMYESGLGVEKDHKIAIEWYMKSAEKGDCYAKKNLDWLAKNGYRVEKSYQRSMTM